MFEPTKTLRNRFSNVSATEVAVSDPKTLFAIMNNKIFDSLLHIFGGSDAPTIYILHEKDVFKADIDLDTTEEELYKRIKDL